MFFVFPTNPMANFNVSHLEGLMLTNRMILGKKIKVIVGKIVQKIDLDFANDTFSSSALSQPQREGVCVLGQNILPPVKFWKMLKQELPLHIEFQIKFKLKIIFYH